MSVRSVWVFAFPMSVRSVSVFTVLIVSVYGQCHQECDFYPWEAWDCTPCSPGSGTQPRAVRVRGICCLSVTDPFACMNSCNYTYMDVEEYGPCVNHCAISQNIPLQSTDTSVSVTSATSASTSRGFNTTTVGPTEPTSPCYVQCIGEANHEQCLQECLHNHQPIDICTILAISLFILGVLIGAVTTATIVRCCCHDKKLRKLRPTRNKDVTMVRECNTDDPPPTGRIDISTPQKEKRELRRVMDLAKNHRQVSPFSSSANLMEADWSRGDGEESPRVPTKRWSGSIPTDQVTEQFETKMKPSFFVGTRPSSMVMRTPGAFTDSHTGTNESGPIKSRGNIWLTE